MEFGIAVLQVRELIEFLNFTLSSPNAAVRTNSVTVLGALFVFVRLVADKALPKPIKQAIVEVISNDDSGKNTTEELFPKVDITSRMLDLNIKIVDGDQSALKIVIVTERIDNLKVAILSPNKLLRDSIAFLANQLNGKDKQQKGTTGRNVLRHLKDESKK
ncbi:3703_t:CDS:2 [Funneliformis mosseae]|uniref:3703_t:CDS:1 n=1 Tax=Funneliformis mosseae TaxID=27381 RepID=A0A9N8VYA6_FUNMO|nr:3703_t:CDS:2 [Funneliformis mosseae]